MQKIEYFSSKVEAELSSLKFSEKPANLYDPLRYFLQIGGKRMRPVLTLLSAELFDVPEIESLPAALAVELFHNFTLLHDDIMDNAPVRRGMKTVHEKWSRDVAILSGDALMIEAYKQLSFYTDQRLSEFLILFNRTAIEVCEGQQFDMDFEQHGNIVPTEYLEMIRLKTSVLVACAMEFGAILANQSSEVRALLYSFGLELGLAFQIQDDLLDLYADPLKFGKQVGGDILAEKKTLLYLTAKELAVNAGNESEFEAIFQLTNETEKVQRAKVFFENVGAKKAVMDQKESHHQKAIAVLEALAVPESKKSDLFAVANQLLHREI